VRKAHVITSQNDTAPKQTRREAVAYEV